MLFSEKARPLVIHRDAVRLQRMSDFRPSPYFSHNATTRRKNGSPIMVGSPPCRAKSMRSPLCAAICWRINCSSVSSDIRQFYCVPGTAPLFQDRSNMCNQYCKSHRRVWPLRDNLLPPCQTSPLKNKVHQRHETMRRLSSPRNITEWKTSFCAMRALGDHDRKNDLRGNSCFEDAIRTVVIHTENLFIIKIAK